MDSDTFEKELVMVRVEAIRNGVSPNPFVRFVKQLITEPKWLGNLSWWKEVFVFYLKNGRVPHFYWFE